MTLYSRIRRLYKRLTASSRTIRVCGRMREESKRMTLLGIAGPHPASRRSIRNFRRLFRLLDGHPPFRPHPADGEDLCTHIIN
jgi:hypothetical protein